MEHNCKRMLLRSSYKTSQSVAVSHRQARNQHFLWQLWWLWCFASSDSTLELQSGLQLGLQLSSSEAKLELKSDLQLVWKLEMLSGLQSVRELEEQSSLQSVL